MIHLPRRHFFQSRNEKHYKKNRGRSMGGPLNLDSTAWVPKDTVQETIDSLNAAIDKLDKLIHEMTGNCECKN